MTIRFGVGVMAGLLALPMTAQAQTSPEGPTTAEVSSAISRSKATRNAALSTLRKRVERVEWNEMNFEFVLDWLREQSGGSMNVVAATNALGVAGVEAETPVTLSLRNTTVAEVLDETLQQVSQDGNVRYRAIGNTLRISTTADFNRKLFVRVYDVTDLLFKIPDFDDAPEIDLSQAQQSTGGGGAGGQSPPVFSGAGGGGAGEEEETEEELQERLEELRLLIEETLEPTFWDTGGGPGSIRAYNKLLVIRASVEVHEEIAGFFSFQ